VDDAAIDAEGVRVAAVAERVGGVEVDADVGLRASDRIAPDGAHDGERIDQQERDGEQEDDRRRAWGVEHGHLRE